MGRFPVLMYHRIVSDRCPVPGRNREEARYAVTLEDFRSQVARIAGSGRRAVSMTDVYDSLVRRGEVPREWIAVTFDDGNTSDFEHARPILLEREFSGTFFVSGERLGVPGGLEPEMVAAMARDGLEIGSHGMTHRFLTTLTAREETDEMQRSRSVLRDASGASVNFYAPPGGRIGRRGVAELKRLGYLGVCNSVFGFNRTAGQRFEFSRIAVTASTTPAVFDRIVDGKALALMPLYARDRSLRWARRILGEKVYGRVRASGLGS